MNKQTNDKLLNDSDFPQGYPGLSVFLLCQCLYSWRELKKSSDWKCDFLAKQLTTNQHGHFEAQQN